MSKKILLVAVVAFAVMQAASADARGRRSGGCASGNCGQRYSYTQAFYADKSATQAPVQAPAKGAVQAPVQAPTKGAVQAPVQAPAKGAVQAPAKQVSYSTASRSRGLFRRFR